MTKTRVIATIRVIGFHLWTGAPEVVAYLRERHRHVFTVRAEFRVTHTDRDVEFHLAQAAMRDMLSPYLKAGLYEFGPMSCEHIAEYLLAKLGQCTAVEVWEDDENGARVEAA